MGEGRGITKNPLRPTASLIARMEGHGDQSARRAASDPDRGARSGEDDPRHAGATGSSPNERVERSLFWPSHDSQAVAHPRAGPGRGDRKSTRLNSSHTVI